MKSLCFGQDMDEKQQDGQRVIWEYHHLSINRVDPQSSAVFTPPSCESHEVPGYGFGIAVCGGKDNAHGGDSPISVSDVLKSGPAEGKLQVNDHLVTINNIPLENVDYSMAVQLLRDCGPVVHLVVKRRVLIPTHFRENIKVTLTKAKKKDDLGLVLGCRLYIKEITSRSHVEKGSHISEGDVITKINGANTENLSLREARKILESCKEKLQLVIRKDDFSKFLNGTYFDISSKALSKGDPITTPAPPPALPYEDKRTGGRHRGPVSDISQLEQLLPAPPRPPLPEYAKRREPFEEDPVLRRNKGPLPDQRYITFHKEGSVGIRLTGGNEVGIFVTAVQPGSAASLQGLQPGDKLLKVNGMDMKGLTREEAVNFLHSVQDTVNLLVQYKKEDYDDIVATQKGDSFYIRTHFRHDGGENGTELSFNVGEVFHVTDTFYNGISGSWQVYRLSRTHQSIQRGIIPNKTRAEECAQDQFNQAKKESNETGGGGSRVSFFRRRAARRSKSLNKENWEDIVFDGLSKFPAYERVTLKHPGFVRPIVLFGPLAELARDKLLKDYPDKFIAPSYDGILEDTGRSSKSPPTIIRLSAIKEIVEKGKHAVLDIPPTAVDRLNYAQFYPIVIFLRAENKHTVKELLSRMPKSSSSKSTKKLYDQAVKLEKLWSHIFTAIITLSSADMWYKKVRETIDKQQGSQIWMSESKPKEAIGDDFLFPLSPSQRLSYASSPDLDLSPPRPTSPMMKASSDPSIATQEETVPHYRPVPRQEPPQIPEPSTPIQRRGYLEENEYFVSRYASISPGMRQSILHNGDSSYAGFDCLEPPRVVGGAGIPPPSVDMNNKVPPPRVDRASKPTQFRDNIPYRMPPPAAHMNNRSMEAPDYINTKSQSLERARLPMDGVYDFTSYGGGGGGPQYPSNLPRDRYSAVSGGYRPPPPHVPPKYTNKPMVEPPPPKPQPYSRLTDRPVPPPKPAGYMAQPKTWPPDDSLAPPPYSMDPRYDRPLPRPYPPRGHEPPPYSPTTSLIERGSAFELYKKPERAMYPK